MPKFWLTREDWEDFLWEHYEHYIVDGPHTSTDFSIKDKSLDRQFTAFAMRFADETFTVNFIKDAIWCFFLMYGDDLDNILKEIKRGDN